MKNLNVRYSNHSIGGLNFQIVKIVDNRIDFNQSIVLHEEVFALIENSFASVFSLDSEQYQYYHWGKHYHNSQDIEKIIQNLNNLKETILQDKIDDLNYFWLDEIDMVFLKENSHLLIKIINDIIHFIEKNKRGICVIGI